MANFIHGMDLCRGFHDEVVAPLMAKHFGGISYSAGRLGGGSDVLGFDTERSTDHDWGPQTDIFLAPSDYDKSGSEIYDLLAHTLPLEYRGFSTNFDNDYLMGSASSHPIVHRVRVHTVNSFFTSYIGRNPLNGLDDIAWLSIPGQRLRTVISGGVFRDDLGSLSEIRGLLRWYPDDIWIFLLACQWVRIDQEEPFAARCGDVGDELGSRVVAARQVHEIMRLCFLMERQYAPYTKWFGTAFERLSCAPALSGILKEVFEAPSWKEREKTLSVAYLELADIHNALGITEHIRPEVTPFYDRPYLVPHSSRFVDALMKLIDSKWLAALQRPVGSVHQFTDSTDVACWPEAWAKLAGVYSLIDSDDERRAGGYP